MRNKIMVGLTTLLLAAAGVLGSAGPASASGPGYYYAGAYQTLTGTNNAGGLSANIYIANAFIPAGQCVSGGDHSLMEIEASDTSGNTVEFGWAEEPTAFGDCKPRLFASTWNAGTWSGCYGSGAGCNWVDNASNPVNLGADLSSTAALCNGSSLACVKKFTFYYSATACGAASSGWWLQYDGSFVGCFTPSAFGAGFTAVTQFQAFGEYYYSGATVPCGDMGNGKASTGALGNTGPSYFGSVSLANPSPTTLTTSFTAMTSTVPAAYDITMVGTSGRTFAVSGAGYTSGGSTPGNIGSC